MKSIIAIIVMAIATSAHATSNDHGKPDNRNPQSSQVTQKVGVSVQQSARAEAKAQAKAIAAQDQKQRQGQQQNAAGGTGIGGSAEATGGAASATGGNVIVNGAGSGSGLTGRMVPDVSASSPITSTSCRNGITAGGSGNGWGGLIGFFSEDEFCEFRLLWEQFRTAGQHDKADKLLDGMMAIRCEKMSPDNRKLFGDLCPKQTPVESQNVAFSSGG